MAKSKIHYERSEFEEMEKALSNIIVDMKNVSAGASAITELEDMYTAGQALDAVQNLKNAAKRYDDLLSHYVRMYTLLEKTWYEFESRDYELAHKLNE